MKMTVCIPIFNQLHDAKGILTLLRDNTSPETEFMFIDNGSAEPIEPFILKYLKPKRLNLIRNEENLGVVKTFQQAYENCTTDVLTIVHNDVYIYEKNWDKRMLSYFETIEKLGAASLFGSSGCGPRGERMQDVPHGGVMAGMTNMLEAEIHGMRMRQPYHAAAIFDGFLMSFSMEMLRGGNGFDTRYEYHHIYDRDAALESIKRGYKNIVVDIPCHHVCGLTANRPEYQNWINEKIKTDNFSADKYTHDHNSDLFESKWQDVLPLYVEPDFSFRSGQSPLGVLKGDAITRL